MRQLTSLDAQFLALENGRTHGHVGSIAIYDPSSAPGGVVTLADLKRMLRERMHLLKPFSWRLVSVPFGLDHPFWAEDEVDLDYTSASLRCRLRAICASSPTRPRGSSSAAWTVTTRCGRCT